MLFRNTKQQKVAQLSMCRMYTVPVRPNRCVRDYHLCHGERCANSSELSLVLSFGLYAMHFTIACYYDWAYVYKSKELINFWWWSGSGYGFRITFTLHSPLRNTGFFKRFISISNPNPNYDFYNTVLLGQDQEYSRITSVFRKIDFFTPFLWSLRSKELFFIRKDVLIRILTSP